MKLEHFGYIFVACYTIMVLVLLMLDNSLTTDVVILFQILIILLAVGLFMIINVMSKYEVKKK